MPFNYDDHITSKTYTTTVTTENPKAWQPLLNGEEDQEIKADAGKPKLRFVPWEIVNDIAYVREYGVKKYHAVDSWKEVEPERYVDALLRHTLAFAQDPAGEDEESGMPHLWHVACNVAFLCEYLKVGKLDDLQ